MSRAAQTLLRDIDIINLELILADAEMCRSAASDKAQKAAKGGDKRFLREAEVFSAAARASE